MKIKFNEDKNLEERLNFARSYVKRIKSVDDEDRSSQHADFINSLLINSLSDGSTNFRLDAYTYFKFQNKNIKNY
ncbi:conserved hypothetical protein [groundwater metagenome]|uniref:Uncharacterized protein n=1 Tax=groundwater metagenome TaxID=717931 RepID=A0A098E705_9ZZZZ